MQLLEKNNQKQEPDWAPRASAIEECSLRNVQLFYFIKKRERECITPKINTTNVWEQNPQMHLLSNSSERE